MANKKKIGTRLKQPFCFTLDPGIVDEIEKQAKTEGFSRSFLVNRILKDYVEKS